MAALGMLGKLGDLAEATRHTLLAALPAAKAGRPGSRRGVAARAARRRSTAALGVVALAAGAIGVVATRSPGYPTQRVEPNDGAVWVTNDRVGLFGRLNGPARALDTALAPVDKTQNHQLDVLQAGATVVARDRVAGRLAPIDVRSGQLLKDRAIPSPPTGSAPRTNQRLRSGSLPAWASRLAARQPRWARTGWSIWSAAPDRWRRCGPTARPAGLP